MRNLTRLTALAGATAGTLALVGGVAFASPAPQLSGSYSVKVTRTVSEGLTNQPVGQSGVEPWKVTSTCTTPTTCTTTLNWTGLSGKQYQYKTALTKTAKMQYTAAHTFTQTCRGHKGAKIAMGWSVSQTTRIVGSHVTAGRIDHFSSTISTTYTPTSAGTTGGCSAAKEVLSGTV
jgi:hypothetical protein